MAEIAVDIPTGDSYRLCHDIAQIATESSDEVETYKYTTRANTKSIIDLLALNPMHGERLYIKSNDEEVLNKIRKLFN